MENKWNEWYNNLPAHTREYLDQQAVWHDSDVAKMVSVALVVGIIIGYILA